MKRKIILIDKTEFNDHKVTVPSIIDFEGVEAVVFIVKETNEFGGLKFLGMYLAVDVTVSYTQVPLAQVIEIGGYGSVPDEPQLYPQLLNAYQLTDTVPQEHARTYTTPTEIKIK